MNPCSRVELLVVILSAVGLSLPLAIASGGVSHANAMGKRTTGQTSAGATRSMIVGSGEVRPTKYVKVKSESAGRIHQIHVEPGDEIAKGQPLLVIEPQSNAQAKVTLYSPLKGIVADVSTRVGEAVQSDGTLMTLADMSRIFVEVNIDGSDISRVAVGQRARIVVDAFHESPIRGLVIRKDPHPVSESGDLEFKVTMEVTGVSNAIRRRIRPGMSLTASIQSTQCKKQPVEDLVKTVAEAFVNRSMGTLDADRAYVGRIKIVIERSLAEDKDPQRFVSRWFRSLGQAEAWLQRREHDDLHGRATKPLLKCAGGVCTYDFASGILHNTLFLKRITYSLRNGCPYVKTIHLLDGD